MEAGKLFSLKPEDMKMSQTSRSPVCDCFTAENLKQHKLHAEVQDTNCEAWKALERLIDAAAAKGAEEFAPGLEMPPELWHQIVTLPPSISRLTSVRKLYLYGSYLVRLPPEIGDMVNLEELDPYTSYRLHWLPYEVTRCRITKSRISTRTLYGNYKYRRPYPKLGTDDSKNNLPGECSVCRQALHPESVHQMWISLRVATDVLPLLVNACSDECIRRLPAPAYGYVDHPHTGGPDLVQPSASFMPPRPGAVLDASRRWGN